MVPRVPAISSVAARVRRARFGAPVAVVTLASVMVFWRLGDYSVLHGDEAVYSLVSRNVYRGGDWLFPSLDGEAFLMKAPLTFWGTAVAYLVLGVSELSTRLFAGVSAALAVLVTFLLARRVFRSTVAGWIAGAALTLNPVFLHVHCARNGETDAPMLFLFLFASYAFWNGLERSCGRWLAVSAASVGLMAMSKSLAVAALPLAAFGLTLVVLGRLRAFSWRGYLGAAASFLLVVGPWHVLAYLRFGDDFLAEYLSSQVVARIEASSGASGYEWNLLQSLVDLHPFSVLLAVSPWLLLVRAREHVRRGGMFLLVWLGVATAVAFGVEPRLPWYIVPAYPAAACLIGGAAVELGRRSPLVAWPTALASVVLASGWTVDPGFNPYANSATVAAISVRLVPASLLAMVVTPAVASAAVLLHAFLRRRREEPFAFSPAAVLATCGVSCAAALQAAEPFRHLPFRSNIDELTDSLRQARAGGRALYFGRVMPPLAERWYLDDVRSSDPRNIEYFCDREEDFLARAADPAVTVLMLPATELLPLRDRLRTDWEVLDVAPTACTGLPVDSHQRLVVLSRRAHDSSAPFGGNPGPYRAGLKRGRSLQVRTEAALRLGIAGDRERTREILALGLREPAAFSAALSALRWMGDTSVLEDLRPLVMASDADRQIEVLTTLASLGDATAIPALRSLRLVPAPGDSHIRRTRASLNAALQVLFARDFVRTCTVLANARIVPSTAITITYTAGGKRAVLEHLRVLLEAPDPAVRRLAVWLLTRPDSRILQLTADEKTRFLRLPEVASHQGDDETRQTAEAALRAFNPGVWSGSAWMRGLKH